MHSSTCTPQPLPPDEAPLPDIPLGRAPLRSAAGTGELPSAPHTAAAAHGQSIAGPATTHPAPEQRSAAAAEPMGRWESDTQRGRGGTEGQGEGTQREGEHRQAGATAAQPSHSPGLLCTPYIASAGLHSVADRLSPLLLSLERTLPPRCMYQAADTHLPVPTARTDRPRRIYSRILISVQSTPSHSHVSPATPAAHTWGILCPASPIQRIATAPPSCQPVPLS